MRDSRVGQVDWVEGVRPGFRCIKLPPFRLLAGLPLGFAASHLGFVSLAGLRVALLHPLDDLDFRLFQVLEPLFAPRQFAPPSCSFAWSVSAAFCNCASSFSMWPWDKALCFEALALILSLSSAICPVSPDSSPAPDSDLEERVLQLDRKGLAEGAPPNHARCID